jgi:hypothetical protein
VLPKPTGPTATIVVIIKPGGYDPDKYSIMDALSVSTVLTKVSHLLIF